MASFDHLCLRLASTGTTFDEVAQSWHCSDTSWQVSLEGLCFVQGSFCWSNSFDTTNYLGSSLLLQLVPVHRSPKCTWKGHFVQITLCSTPSMYWEASCCLNIICMPVISHLALRERLCKPCSTSTSSSTDDLVTLWSSNLTEHSKLLVTVSHLVQVVGLVSKGGKLLAKWTSCN